MAEVQIRLSEMREAAERMRRASDRLQQSTQAIRDCLTTLQTQGGQSYLLLMALKTYPDELPAQLTRFAENLDLTANEIELLYAQMENDFELLLHRPKVWFVGAAALMRRQTATTKHEDSEEAPLFNVDDYVARVNNPLYRKLMDKRQLLSEQQQELDRLNEDRQRLSDELSGLQDRLRSYDPSVNFKQVPRVQTLESQITQLDGQIQAQQVNVDELQADIGDITHRLDRVKPAAGADLNLIAELENRETMDYIKANTYDCVKHVVHKLTIPDALAQNAHLWDDIAMQRPELGITVSSTPLEGSVLLMEREHSYSDDLAGHIMYVERVDNGVVWVTDNNHAEPVKLSDLTQELDTIKYLYFPWHTRA